MTADAKTDPGVGTLKPRNLLSEKECAFVPSRYIECLLRGPCGPRWKWQPKPEAREQPDVPGSADVGPILGVWPANERRRYKVTSSLIGWAQT